MIPLYASRYGAQSEMGASSGVRIPSQRLRLLLLRSSSREFASFVDRFLAWNGEKRLCWVAGLITAFADLANYMLRSKKLLILASLFCNIFFEAGSEFSKPSLL